MFLLSLKMWVKSPQKLIAGTYKVHDEINFVLVVLLKSPPKFLCWLNLYEMWQNNEFRKNWEDLKMVKIFRKGLELWGQKLSGIAIYRTVCSNPNNTHGQGTAEVHLA